MYYEVDDYVIHKQQYISNENTIMILFNKNKFLFAICINKLWLNHTSIFTVYE